MIPNEQVVYVFIDASNLWQVQKAKRRLFDYAKLKSFLAEKFTASEIEIFYYAAYPAEGTRSQNLDGRHKFFTYLKKGLGFVVRKKELKRIFVRGKGGDSMQEKGNMDVEMTIDVMHYLARYSVAVFFTGDSDFFALVNYIRSTGKKVYIFSSRNNVSHELRTGADGYFDILALECDIWGKELSFQGIFPEK